MKRRYGIFFPEEERCVDTYDALTPHALVAAAVHVYITYKCNSENVFCDSVLTLLRHMRLERC